MVIVHQPLAAAELKRARQDLHHIARRVLRAHGDASQDDQNDGTQDDASQDDGTQDYAPQDDASQDDGTQRGPLECFRHALSLAQGLLFESPSFVSLARRMEEIDEVYDCGGKGSAVLDSFLVLHVMSDRTQGVASESPLSVAAFVLRHLGAPAEFSSHAEAFAASRLHVVWCEALGEDADDPGTARLRCPVTGRQWRAEVMEPWFRAGLGYLARIVELPDRSFVLTTPYVLLSSEDAWREYFARQLGTPGKAPAGGKGGASRDKGKRKKAKRAPAGAADSPAQRLHRHMKRGPSPDYWIEFVDEAFAGKVNGCPALAGVPDLPETFPRNPEFDEEGDHPWLELLDEEEEEDDEDEPELRVAEVPVSPEVEDALASAVLEQVRRSMRGPIPMFGDRSLVELVQTEGGREQARAWLVGQEQTLRSLPQLAEISLEPLWRELGLDYEG